MMDRFLMKGIHTVAMQGSKNSQIHVWLKICLLSASLLSLIACDSNQKEQKNVETAQHAPVEKRDDILPFLNIQEVPAKFALPFCEKNNCLEMSIQTIQTQDNWINAWIERSQAEVIQNQIGSEQAMTLQQAINTYVKKSDAWQAEFKKNDAYTLDLTTRIASQRNQYVLLQVIVNTKQQGVTVKDRGYFFVADRKLQKKLALLDLIDKKQQNALNDMIQAKYAEWINEQSTDVKKIVPKKLYWGQSDWFFDDEGVGLHYRANEIVKDGAQLDIYLTKPQTKQILKPEIFEKMF